MSDFPRGWTRSVEAAGVAASITVAGIPGVSHVLDAISAQIATTGAFASWTVLLSSSDGTFNNFVLGRATAATAAGGSIESGEVDRSGLDLAAGPGASLTIAFQGSAAGTTETLVIQGHDV